MTNPDDPDPEEHFEKVKEGIGPEEKTSYAPAKPGEEAKQRAEDVEYKVHEDRAREEGPSHGQAPTADPFRGA